VRGREGEGSLADATGDQADVRLSQQPGNHL
jgi:hypothetical protein